MQPNTSPYLNRIYLTSPLLELPPNILTYWLTVCKHEIKHTMDATLDKTLDKTGQTYFLTTVLPARVRHIRAEALQQRIRHADEKANARCPQLVNESSNFNYLPPSLLGNLFLTFGHKALEKGRHLRNRYEDVSVSVAKASERSFQHLAPHGSSVVRGWQGSSSTHPVRDSRHVP